MAPGIISLVSIGISAWLLTGMFRPTGPLEIVIVYAPFYTAHIILAGFVTSSVNQLASPTAWMVVSVIMVLAVAGLSCLRLPMHCKPHFTAMPRPVSITHSRYWRNQLHWFLYRYARLSASEKRLIIPLLLTAFALMLVNFDLARNVAPMNWDSMTYHLSRMAYFLQQGNIGYYDANYWAQIVHPKDSTLLVLYTYLVSGRNENLTQLVQFAAYAIAALSIYGICRRLDRGRFSSLFAALVFALLIECLMESNTTQNDMLLTAMVGITTYSLLAFRQRRSRRYLLLGALTIGIALGIKSAVLLIAPSLAVIAVYALVKPGCMRVTRHGIVLPPGAAPNLQHAARDILTFALAVAGAVTVFALPAGYIDNIRLFGNPIGTEYVRKLHSFEGESLAYMVQNGTRNLLRYGFDFLSFDGLPPGGTFIDLQLALRKTPRSLVEALGFNLETTEATRAPFQYDKVPSSHEDSSYWGILGFALVIPIALLSLLRVIKSRGNWILAAATVLFALAQAYSGPYDPWRGRYFIIMAIFAVPAVACCVRWRNPIWRSFLMAVVLIACMSAFTAVLGRWNDMPEEVYTMNRLEQLTRNRRNYCTPIRRFNELVPVDATVAVFLGEDSFDYPLFGAGLTRILIPINSFLKGPQPIPAQADYLLYSSDLYRDRYLADIHLGEDWYLRRLYKPVQ